MRQLLGQLTCPEDVASVALAADDDTVMPANTASRTTNKNGTMDIGVLLTTRMGNFAAFFN